MHHRARRTNFLLRDAAVRLCDMTHHEKQGAHEILGYRARSDDLILKRPKPTGKTPIELVTYDESDERCPRLERYEARDRAYDLTPVQ